MNDQPVSYDSLDCTQLSSSCSSLFPASRESKTMKNQPVLYESLKTILSHTDANLRIKMSLRMPSIRATEKLVPLKMRYLSMLDTKVKINNVCYELMVYRDYPNGDVLPGVEDFDRFGFEIPIGSDPILPGDVSVRKRNRRVRQTDTDELEEHYRNELTMWENQLQMIAVHEHLLSQKDRFQKMAEDSREKLKPFHCRRHNFPRPFNCYIQLSTGKAKPLERLVYNRKLYEAVKQFNHILFANRPVIRVNELVCLGNQVYRIPVGMKISANELTTKQSQIASIAKILEGDVNTLRVYSSQNARNWWRHRIVKNAKELITDHSPSAEQSALMIRTLCNKVIRLNCNRQLMYLEARQYCELIENWMSVKRTVGSELWIRFFLENDRNKFLQTVATRTDVIRREERCLRIRNEHGTQIELCVVETRIHPCAVQVKIIEN
ncbi:unnamed protein product [Caenorhabditis nigoni]